MRSAPGIEAARKILIFVPKDSPMAADNWVGLDSGVPFVAAVLPEPAPAAAELVEAFDGADAHDVFGHFIAELPFHPQPQRRPVLNGERRAVEVVGEDRLRMEGVDEVVSFVIMPGAVERLLEFVGAEKGDVARPGLELGF